MRHPYTPGRTFSVEVFDGEALARRRAARAASDDAEVASRDEDADGPDEDLLAFNLD